MAQYFRVHPDNPQKRLLRQAVEIVRRGGVIVYPTDSAYALGCQLGERSALERIQRIRALDEGHHFTLACRDLSELSSYAMVSDRVYRLLKAHTPGPYTFVLPSTRQVPKRLLHPKQKTIGLRVPEHRITQALLEELGEALMTTTLILPGESLPLCDPEDIAQKLGKHVELVIDGGSGGLVPTTLIDLSGDAPVVLRSGRGDAAAFL